MKERAFSLTKHFCGSTTAIPARRVFNLFVLHREVKPGLNWYVYIYLNTFYMQIDLL